jgi:antitoxin ParD1/3/4
MFCTALPYTMKEWVEEQARSGRYGNTSDYVRQLISHGQERKYKTAHM